MLTQIALKTLILIGFSLQLVFAGSEESEEDAAPPSQQTPAKPKKPPTFHNIRFEEVRAGDADDSSLKHIPLNDSGSAFLFLGGQIRIRGESWNNFGFLDAAGRSDTFGLLRIRLHADMYLGPHVRFFVEGKSAQSTGRSLPGGNRTLDIDSLDIQNLILDLKAPVSSDGSVVFRLGRQELQFGKQRLISPLDWSNTRPRTFDMARTVGKFGNWRVDGFWGRHVKVEKYSFNSDYTGSDLYGAYLTGKPGSGTISSDFYWLGLDRDAAPFGGVSGQVTRQTFGTRWGGKPGTQGFDFDVEAAFQVGDHAGRDIRAYMFASQIGFSPREIRLSPRFYLGFDYASGDDDPLDGDVGTFNQLFPLGHAYYGYADVVGRQNAVDLSLGTQIKPVPRLSFKFDGHFFWRAEELDALYNAGGGIVRQGGPGTSKRVGNEFDLTVRFVVLPNAVVSGGFSYFWAGDFIRETGPDDNIAFAHYGIQYTF